MHSFPPLAGIVVVELGHSVAAPCAGLVLGDLGADVIKVEKPAGDDGLFRKFCGVLGCGWCEEARFRTNPERVKNAPELYRMIEGGMLKRGNAEWIAALGMHTREVLG